MCGIAGIFAANAREATVDLMLAALAHRGPDEFGTFSAPGIAMGTARLSIVDLQHGQQPMRDEGSGVVIVLNGEVFNYKELRETLAGQGHCFLTHSDTEVALRLYLQHGDRFPAFINGQFAIAIWDPRTGTLLLTRDRVGICPLYYFSSHHGLIFASEIKSLLTNAEIPRDLNHRALDQIFTFWTPIGHHTAIRDISELLPGCSLIQRSDGVRIAPYWTWPFPTRDLQTKATFAEAAEELVEHLTRSISLRLQADVEVASYLSGGLDSSTIVALACRRLSQAVRTYSIEFSEKSYDESEFQTLVAQKYGTRHVAVQCSEENIAQRFEEVIWHTECPLFRTAPTPLQLLSERVHQDGLKVVLTGEGADEVLFGYDIFREVKIRRFCARFPASQMRPALFKRLYQYLPQFANPRYANLAIESFKGTLASLSPFYSHEIRWSNNSANKVFFSQELRDSLNGYNALEEMESLLPGEYFAMDDLKRAQYLEIVTLLRGYLLSSQGDRMTMSNSVEARFPFLDHEFLQFASRLPQKFTLRGLRDKHILRESMKQYLPEAVTGRAKFAYQAPEIRAFCGKNTSSPLVHQYLSDQAIKESGLFDSIAVTKLMTKIRKSELARLGTRDNMAFVQILSTQIFCDRFLSGNVRQQALDSLDRCRFTTRLHAN